MKRRHLPFVLAMTICLSLIIPAFAAQTYTPSWLEKGVTLEDTPYFSDPLTAVNKDGRWGYTDRLGRMAIAPLRGRALDSFPSRSRCPEALFRRPWARRLL